MKRTTKPLLYSGQGMSDAEINDLDLQIYDMINSLQRFRDCLDEHESVFMNCDGELADKAGKLLLELAKGLDARRF